MTQRLVAGGDGSRPWAQTIRARRRPPCAATAGSPSSWTRAPRSGSPPATTRRRARPRSARRCRARGATATSQPSAAASQRVVAPPGVGAVGRRGRLAAQRSRSASKAACCLALEGGDRARVVGQEAAVVAQAEGRLLHLERNRPLQEVVAVCAAARWRHRIEADLVEEPQQPRLPARSRRSRRKRFHICTVRPTN